MLLGGDLVTKRLPAPRTSASPLRKVFLLYMLLLLFQSMLYICPYGVRRTFYVFLVVPRHSDALRRLLCRWIQKESAKRPSQAEPRIRRQLIRSQNELIYRRAFLIDGIDGLEVVDVRMTQWRSEVAFGEMIMQRSLERCMYRG